MPRDDPGPYVLAAGPLTAVVQRHGAVTWLRTDSILVNLHPASALEPGPANLWLRRRDGSARPISAHPMLGPASGSRVRAGGATMEVTGQVDGITYRARLSLGADPVGWRWSVELTNDAAEPALVDVLMTQDCGLADPGAVRSNELYVSQYLDVTPLPAPQGTALAVRQNQPQHGRTPWLVLGCTGPTAGWATDARQVYGLALRGTDPPYPGPVADLPGERLQHEHTLAALQTEPFELALGATVRTGFVAVLVADHPAVTGPDDLAHLADGMDRLSDATVPEEAGSVPAVATVFAPVRPLPADDLTAAEVAERYGEPRQPEYGAAGSLLSFFDERAGHVVLRAKEQQVLRPHGHLMRTGTALLPDPASLTATTWMSGSQLSYLTQGHASTDRLLSTVRGYLGWHRAYGLRIFAEVDGRWQLLEQPSAWELTPQDCRWAYRGPYGEIIVTTRLPADQHLALVEVQGSTRRRYLLALHLATGGDDGLEPGAAAATVEVQPDRTVVTVGVEPGTPSAERYPQGTFRIALLDGAAAATIGGDGPLFADGSDRGLRWLTAVVEPTDRLALEVTGRLVLTDATSESGTGADLWADLTAAVAIEPPADVAGGREVSTVGVALPWLVRDALVHYLSPRGLEQYTGGAWGTRDVSQGPVELLLALGRTRELRALLLLVLAAQDTDGHWPQAFGFLPGDEQFRMGPAHGDVIFWPVLAVGRYLVATGDASLLDQTVRYADGPPATVWEHLRRALEVAAAEVLPGTHLTAYGHGDWNDSLQPADPAMAAAMTSSWTVTLHHQTLRALGAGLRAAGRTAAAEQLEEQATVVAAEFTERLVVDDVVTGYAHLDQATGAVRLLVHPRDAETGLRFSALPMIHAVADGLFDRTRAAQHLELIRRHLLGADGVRLFDRPPVYAGGRTTHFQRAETATFVGREIGLMYTHAHLRYLEALAMWGDADALWLGLRQVLNVGVETAVPNARPRQANTYASSSDAAVPDRAAFAERYAEIMAGQVPVEGGWRIYSSGPGIAVRLVRECLFGLRVRPTGVEIDPVLTGRLDGVATWLRVAGRQLKVRYRVGAQGHGPVAVRLAGRYLPFTRLDHPYRTGGVLVAQADLADGAELEVVLP